MNCLYYLYSELIHGRFESIYLFSLSSKKKSQERDKQNESNP